MSFALICTLCVSLTSGGTAFPPLVNSLLLWVIVFFSAMSGLAHIFMREEDERTALFLRTVSSPEAIFIAKALFNILFFTAVVSLILPLFLFFLQVEVSSYPLLILCLYAGRPHWPVRRHSWEPWHRGLEDGVRFSPLFPFQ
jgi:heme exporter protein B